MVRIKKKSLIIISAVILAVAFLFPGATASAQAETVYIGGMPAGFTLGLGGAQVVGICEVLSENGPACPAKEAGLETGDLIVSIGGVSIASAEEIDKALSATLGKPTDIVVKREEEKCSKKISPVKDKVSGRYRLGVLIRDSISGIGTVTYIRKSDLRFGSLGHAVAGRNGKLMNISQGDIYRCSIVDVVKGERGKAGELKGLFMNDESIAIAEKNCAAGIYGRFREGYDWSGLKTAEISSAAVPGKATIFTTVDGIVPKEYSVSIVKVDSGNKQNKNFVLKITDAELLSCTGGIVQGMSGSPIMQNGKLIGAVTHVFLNDPTRGYGISISNMIDN